MNRAVTHQLRLFQINLVMIACALLTPITQAANDLHLDRFPGKVVLVDFWASWCVPCRQSFPWLNAMQAKYADHGLVVIGVNVDREQADAQRFLREVPAGFEIVYDPTGSLAAQYEVPGMPCSYVFDPDGKLIGRHIGFRNASRAEREAEIEKLLSAAKNDTRAHPQTN
jgi:thiol-disulfide isomerase/thioredoxin